mmetsp:Transcript_646/g.1336  ORF Transcript_646/g.1336 Transcript_646/m.1336 type:complete len:235 (+) Transcript_646:3060-3764(+)
MGRRQLGQLCQRQRLVGWHRAEPQHTGIHRPDRERNNLWPQRQHRYAPTHDWRRCHGQQRRGHPGPQRRHDQCDRRGRPVHHHHGQGRADGRRPHQRRGRQPGHGERRQPDPGGWAGQHWHGHRQRHAQHQPDQCRRRRCARRGRAGAQPVGCRAQQCGQRRAAQWRRTAGAGRLQQCRRRPRDLEQRHRPLCRRPRECRAIAGHLRWRLGLRCGVHDPGRQDHPLGQQQHHVL